MKNNLYHSSRLLEKRRLLLLQKQLKHAYENIPFYKRFFYENKMHPADIKNLTDLSYLPVITKEIIRENETLFLNKQFPKSKYYYSFSSGSTGEPFKSYFDSTTWFRKKYFSKIRARRECGLRIGEKIAIFETEPSERLCNKNNQLKYIPFPYKIRYFSIFSDPEATLSEIDKFTPENFYGPPGYLFLLAQTYNKNSHSLDKLKRIFTASEYLSANVRSYLEDTFSAPVYDHYGCTETKEIAWQCRERKGYHINEDEIICEILEGDTNLPFGSPGDIVLTDLRNKAMPFIRYRIGDQGMLLKDPCPCGCSYSQMKPMAGRASEYIVLPEGKQISPYVFTTAIESIPGLLKYQIIQENSQQLLVKAILKDPGENHSLTEIQQKLQAVIQNKLNITATSCDIIPIEKNGKFKVVKNLMLSASQ